jgi:hypothetical protein
MISSDQSPWCKTSTRSRLNVADAYIDTAVLATLLLRSCQLTYLSVRLYGKPT